MWARTRIKILNHPLSPSRRYDFETQVQEININSDRLRINENVSKDYSLL